MVGRSSNSLNHLRALLARSPRNKSSQSIPAAHIFWSKILGHIIINAKNPTGSNNLAIFLRKFRLVSGKSFSGGLALNVKTSSPGNHVTPSVFTIGSPSLAMWTSDTLLSTDILSRTLVEFDSYLWACIPALDQSWFNSSYSLIPWLSSTTESIE